MPLTRLALMWIVFPSLDNTTVTLITYDCNHITAPLEEILGHEPAPLEDDVEKNIAVEPFIIRLAFALLGLLCLASFLVGTKRILQYAILSMMPTSWIENVQYFNRVFFLPAAAVFHAFTMLLVLANNW